MAGADSTRHCRHCGEPIADVRRPGPKRQFCNAACKFRERATSNRRKTHRSGAVCAANGCDRPSLSKGYCSAHYSRVRQGNPLDRPIAQKGARVIKPCGYCGKAMPPMRPSIAEKTKFCSRSCATKHRAKISGGPRLYALVCPYCKTEHQRRAGWSDGAYCSRACFGAMRAHIARETQSLYAIADNWKWKQPEAVRLEVCALRRIANWKPGRSPTVRPCMDCGRKCIGTGEIKRLCSDCKARHVKDSAKRSRKTPASRASKKLYKTLRRMRVAGTAIAIDPIAVFIRDKWRCHLCGCKTPQKLRGTYDPNAPELDHVIPLSKGGTHTWGNVKCACRKCNGAKSSKPLGQLGLEIAA